MNAVIIFVGGSSRSAPAITIATNSDHPRDSQKVASATALQNRHKIAVDPVPFPIIEPDHSRSNTDARKRNENPIEGQNREKPYE